MIAQWSLNSHSRIFCALPTFRDFLSPIVYPIILGDNSQAARHLSLLDVVICWVETLCLLQCPQPRCQSSSSSNPYPRNVSAIYLPSTPGARPSAEPVGLRPLVRNISWLEERHLSCLDSKIYMLVLDISQSVSCLSALR